MADFLQFVVDDIRRRQLERLEQELPDSIRGHEARLSEATAQGLRILSGVARHSDAEALVFELTRVADNDGRFDFLRGIPLGPVLSMTRAVALERAVFRTQTEAVAELSLLMSVFTILLDGLIDEAPEALKPIAPWLDEVMRGQAWARGGPAHVPLPDPSLTEHQPVAAATAWLTSEIIRRVTSQPAWEIGTVREEFARASLAAFTSELRSANLNIGSGAPPVHMSACIVEKSTSCIWAGSLVPFCVHGWPEGLDPRTFETFARAVGAYGGWIDDITDILIDLRGNRWSAVLLDLDKTARAFRLQHDTHGGLAVALSSLPLAGHLASEGVDRLKLVRSSILNLGLSEDVLLPALADMTRLSLLDGLAEAA